MKRRYLAAAMAAVVIAGVALGEDISPADEILGQWYTDKNESKVQVVKKDGKYYGTIIWLAEPKYPADDAEAGKIKHDRFNPNKKAQGNPTIGIQVLKDFTYDAADKSWSGGTIYDPAHGTTYKCVIRVQADPKGVDGKSLFVRGYIGIQILGRTTVWYRVPKDQMEKVEAK
jgi:uncharacterized protein (DUF2147 family)